MMRHIIQTRKKDQSNCPNNSRNSGKDREPFLEPGSIDRQCASVPEPTLHNEDDIECDDGNCAHCDEKRLEFMCPDV